MMILLVDDDPAICDLAADVLRTQGFSVLTAQSGLEAVSIWQSHRGEIGLLITDMSMPGMDGQNLATHLAADNCGIRVLFMSGEYWADLDNYREAAFLAKPFMPATLLAEVERLMPREASVLHRGAAGD